MKRLVALLTMTSLAGCAVVSTVHGVKLEQVYQADFVDERLDCCINVDELHPTKEPLEKGSSNVRETPLWGAGNKALLMTLTADQQITANENPSMGVFSTGLLYGPGSFVMVQASFRVPGDPGLRDGWSVGVAARTGARDDLYELKRISATLTFVGRTAEMRYRKEDGTLDHRTIDPGLVGRILDGEQPFTLELFINRKDSRGIATLMAPDIVQQISFPLTAFSVNDPDDIRVLGATLGNCCNKSDTVKVEVTDFEIWEPPRPTFLDQRLKQ